MQLSNMYANLVNFALKSTQKSSFIFHPTVTYLVPLLRTGTRLVFKMFKKLTLVPTGLKIQYQKQL